MSPERWQQVEELLHRALQVDDGARQAFLRSSCDGDPDLLREVESLCAALNETDDFLESHAAEQLPDWPAVLLTGSEAGRQIGPHRLLRELGRGGMSVVYLAVRADAAYEQRLAVKLVKPGLDTESVLRRFRNERQILASLDHPNIARLYDGGTTDDGRPYFVMEPIEGLRIDQYCARHRLAVTPRIELFRRVCSAVQYAHRNLIVHRDIKPSNILVTADGVPKLLDFGIAKLLAPEEFPQTVEPTRTGLRPMTPRYASPEQRQGLLITTASDVYSLGMLLHELLTGHLPEESDADSTDEAPPDGASPGRRLTGDLEKIVKMALREEPERRYDSVEQFSDDLRRYLRGFPVLAQRDTLRYRTRKFLHRHKLPVGAAAAVLVLAAVFFVAMARQVQETAAERHRAELERHHAEQIAELLFDLFESVDPGKSRGGTIAAHSGGDAPGAL